MIRSDLFEKNMGKLSSFFGKKITKDQALLYYEELKNIPREAFEVIVNGLIRTKKPIPSNFPSINDLQLAWLDWLKSHPEKQVKPEPVWCSECGGRGYIEVWYRSKKVKGFVVDGHKVPAWYNSMLPCAMCEAYKDVFSHSKSIKRYTRQQTLDDGFLLHNPYWHGTKPYWKEGYVLNDEPRMVTIDRDDSEEKVRDVEALADGIPF